jgi:hypothetical protein
MTATEPQNNISTKRVISDGFFNQNINICKRGPKGISVLLQICISCIVAVSLKLRVRPFTCTRLTHLLDDGGSKDL